MLFVVSLVVMRSSAIADGYRPMWGHRHPKPDEEYPLRACARVILPRGMTSLDQGPRVTAMIEPLFSFGPLWQNLGKGDDLYAYESSDFVATIGSTIEDVFPGVYSGIR